MKQYLAQKDGYLCVVWQDSNYSEPTIYRNYYACYPMTSHEFEIEFPEGTYRIYENSIPGSYSIFFDTGIRRTLYLADSSAKPIAFETEPYPCPKVRKGIETRYRDGRWEKYLKSSGWQPA
jgi:hypothetical protein